MPLAIAGVPGVKSKLVGQPLLYAISCFASIGVFLVRFRQNHVGLTSLSMLALSSDMIKGTTQVEILNGRRSDVLDVPG